MTREQLDTLRGHTPGPWRHNVGVIYGGVTGKLPIASLRSVQSQADLDAIESNFNGALIAAAPDLLAHIDELTADRDELLDVIRKTEGQRDLLRDEMRRYLPILGALEAKPLAWEWYTDGTGIATLNGYREALKGVDNDNT